MNYVSKPIWHCQAISTEANEFSSWKMFSGFLCIFVKASV